MKDLKKAAFFDSCDFSLQLLQYTEVRVLHHRHLLCLELMPQTLKMTLMARGSLSRCVTSHTLGPTSLRCNFQNKIIGGVILGQGYGGVGGSVSHSTGGFG